MFKKTSEKLLEVINEGDVEKVKVFLAKKRMTKKMFENYKRKSDNPLYVPIETHNPTVFLELLKTAVRLNVDVNKKDEVGMSILHYICYEFMMDASPLLALLEVPNIDVNTTTTDNQTPLHIFCNRFQNVQSYKTVLQRFVDLGTKIDAKNKGMETPLMKTVRNEKLRGLIVQFLIDHGADVNARNNKQNTALHLVAHMSRVDLVNTLVKGGADIYAVNAEGETPLQLAQRKKNFVVLNKFYEVHNLLQWLSSISVEFAQKYALKFLQQEVHPALLKSLNDKEMAEVFEAIAETKDDIQILTKSIKEFNVIEQSESEMRAVALMASTGDRKSLLNCKRLSLLPTSVGSWTIDPASIEFTGETKPSRSNKVGTGSTCSVYRGIYKKDGGIGGCAEYDVAVKIMDEGVDLSESSEFSHEFEIQKSVSHKNIVKFFGIVLEQNVSLVMEFCAHFSLFDVMNDPNQQIDFSTALNFCEQMCTGLDILHENMPSILHRDFKSLNVLVTAKYVLKISDFGMSRFDTPENQETDLKEISGTIPYCCPEIVPSEHSQGGVYTTKSDIYSLGIVFWEIFRRVVFGAYTKPWFTEYNIPAANDFAIFNLLSTGKRPTLSEKCCTEACRNYVPPSIYKMYTDCVAQDPSARPTAKELILTIKNISKEYESNKTAWDKYYVPVGYKKV
ncbi:serine-threonine protein kinase, putative [Entamoeba invadens IP1]|uniref:Serine-threonine protein kinase, putative n=1 Tax=Entamoeba invadens IP1 TaxID=370355 RepID=A0A0A1TZN2_ENTIV|nr:serine-threonine protein kinase, putative [Entamoeba invadens IP1]ELP87029.1 serine-threonine protein kinase, putative [Entamoeba invadens IP1]|eukprot:XP_004253800.1 serine-threonine protein kinase, putative [Entamoeba invadens IP1]